MNLEEMLINQEYDAIWEKYCGYIDLSMEEVMDIQERLLLEQIELLSNSYIGEKIMGEGVKPKSVEEFRKVVPLTTYEDYADVLLNKQEDKLPSKTKYWIQTTWKGGSHPIKLAPFSEEMVKEHKKCMIAGLIFATCERKGQINISRNDSFLYGMAPLPYLTGMLPYIVEEEIKFNYLPPLEEAQTMSFEERNIKGFQLGLERGIDLFFGVSSVLIRIGESFANRSGNKKDSMMKGYKPKTIKMWSRLITAYLKSKIYNRQILPKDIWKLKGLLCAGTDSKEYKERLEYYWGKKPIEAYGGTEITFVATETFGDKGMTFYPDVNFLEFIPEKESLKSIKDKNYIPHTILLNELETGKRYEIVTTKLKGGVFVRYRVGDIIECTALDNKEYGIYQPQIRYVDRVSNVIDLAGFTRITSDTIETSINKTQLPIKEWVVAKEYRDREPMLHLYCELEEVAITAEEVKVNIRKALREVDHDFQDMEQLLERDPIIVTIVEPGSFNKLKDKKEMRISKVNPGEEVINLITG